MKKTILIVDDVESNRELAIAMLYDNKNIDFIEAEDGVMGLDEVNKRTPDLILLDVMMPNMNGLKRMEYYINH